LTSSRDFWPWALRVYAVPGVADACLDLQDAHGQCVPLLLWAAWAAEKGARIDAGLAAEGAALARHWSQEVIVPLRALRRRTKSPVSSGDDAPRLLLREKIKSAELEAERALMTLLEDMTPVASIKNDILKQIVMSAVVEALVVVATAWSPDVPADALAHLTERLTKG